MTRPDPAEARQEIADIIGNSVVEAIALTESLNVERKALEQQDTETLHAVVASKSRHTEQLQSLDDRRSSLCDAWGFDAGPDQMDNLMSWCDEDGVISERWTELLRIAADGNALNLTNGAVIRLRQQQFETSLSVLRGVAPGFDTYGRHGEETGDSSRRSLAEA
ncbi:MAG: flagella synthesis protein FlgN [Woeseiaceae bacterium]